MGNVKYRNTGNATIHLLSMLSVPKASLSMEPQSYSSSSGTEILISWRSLAENSDRMKSGRWHHWSLLLQPSCICGIPHYQSATVSVACFVQECVWVCERWSSVTPPVSLSLCCSALGGRAAHFRKRMGYGKMAEIKRSTEGGCVMNYLCPPPFGVCLVFYNMLCVYVY